MKTNLNQAFLVKVFDTASASCGSSFGDSYSKIKDEREKFLKDVWLDPQDEVSTEESKAVLFRDIDFENIITHAANYLNGSDYTIFLFEIVNISIQFGKIKKAEGVLKSLFSLYRSFINKKTNADSHAVYGDIFLSKNEYESADTEYKKSLAIYKELGSAQGMASVINSMGILKMESGAQYIDAITDFREAKTIARRNNIKSEFQNAILNLSNVSIMMGNYEEARENFESLLPDLREDDDLDMLARVHHNLSIVNKFSGEYDEASANLKLSIDISRELNDIPLLALSYLEKAEISYRMKDYHSSADLATTAFHLFHDIGDKVSCGDIYKILGMINSDMDQDNLAESFFNTSLKINKQYHFPLSLGETLFEMGEHDYKRGNIDRAKENYQNAKTAFVEINANKKLSVVEKRLSDFSN
ncbi:MAG: tetratricopeptide repeat protein [Candidatus Marinimicrobia bacterium]|nr:tetratricopeptide repeat protein [Candidatus Neomarinimicrobiota bacterium]